MVVTICFIEIKICVMIKFIACRHTAEMGLRHTNNPEVNNDPSETVPGMTLSLETLLAKYVKGEQVPLFPGADPGTEDVDLLAHMNSLSRLSKLDKIDAVRELHADIESTRVRLEQRNAVRKAADKAAADALLKKARDVASKAAADDADNTVKN